MIDSHCHLDLKEFEIDWQRVVDNAQRAGVERILVPGTTARGWQKQQAMASTCNTLDIAFGLHPYFFPDNAVSALHELQALLANPSISPVAIGEIGIDGTVGVSVEQQQQLLEAQLQLAAEHCLPVILHHRRSHHLLLESIKRCGFKSGGVVHAFSGSQQVAEQYIHAGFKLGIGGTITYPRASKTRETVAAVDLSHLLLETDAPDMPMAGRQGERNSPVYLGDVASVMAELKSVSVEQVVQQTTDNYYQLFGSRTHCK